MIRIILAVLLTSMVTGCGPSSFTVSGSLAGLLALQQPIESGNYGWNTTTETNSTALQFEQQRDGTYLISEKSSGEPPQVGRFLGPIAGFYLFEGKILDTEAEDNSYTILVVKIEPGGRISLGGGLNPLMAQVIYESLGIPPSAQDSEVTRLTDNPSINVALLQELLVRFRDRVTFEYILVPQS